MVDFYLTKTDKTSDLVETNLSYFMMMMMMMMMIGPINLNNFKRDIFHSISFNIQQVK